MLQATTAAPAAGSIDTLAGLDSIEERRSPAAPETGPVAARIATRVVQLTAQHVGRGPTKARALLGPGLAVVVLEDALTRMERTLVAAGNGKAVREQRRVLQELMNGRVRAVVEEETGRRVTACCSDLAPEAGIEVHTLVLAT